MTEAPRGAKSSVLDTLFIPVNPDYDFLHEPEDQLQYVNPVTLANRVIHFVNASLQLAKVYVVSNRKIAEAKARKLEATHQLEDFDHEILAKVPPPASAKALKLLEAHIRTTAELLGIASERVELLKKLRAAEYDLLLVEVERDNAREVLDIIEQAGRHVQTHLSFVKSEYAKAGIGA